MERATSRLHGLDPASRSGLKQTASTINLAALADDPDTVLLPKFHRYIGRHEPRLEDYNDRRHCVACVFFSRAFEVSSLFPRRFLQIAYNRPSCFLHLVLKKTGDFALSAPHCQSSRIVFFSVDFSRGSYQLRLRAL